jgi:hypothetical protein
MWWPSVAISWRYVALCGDAVMVFGPGYPGPRTACSRTTTAMFPSNFFASLQPAQHHPTPSVLTTLCPGQSIETLTTERTVAGCLPTITGVLMCGILFGTAAAATLSHGCRFLPMLRAIG